MIDLFWHFFLLERKPCRYNCGKISFTQGSTCSLWTGSLGKSQVRKERRKQGGRTSKETGRGGEQALWSGRERRKLRSLIIFALFPLCGACSHVKYVKRNVRCLNVQRIISKMTHTNLLFLPYDNSAFIVKIQSTGNVFSFQNWRQVQNN